MLVTDSLLQTAPLPTGKIEAELWRRQEEAPIALQTLSTAKLEALYAKLRGKGGGVDSSESSSK